MVIRTKLADGKVIVEETVSGPTSYPKDGFDVRMREVRTVEAPISSKADTGLLTEAYLKYATGNVVTVKVYWQTGASGTPMTEVASGYDLSKVRFTVLTLAAY